MSSGRLADLGWNNANKWRNLEEFEENRGKSWNKSIFLLNSKGLIQTSCHSFDVHFSVIDDLLVG